MVHRSIPACQIHLPYDHGLFVERLSIEIYLDNNKFHIHNFHRKYRSQVFHLSPVLNDSVPSIIMGDFNAHNTRWGSDMKPSTSAGLNLATEIDKYPCIVLNDKVRTHNKGSALDLAIFHTSLAPQSHLSRHCSFFSDHFGIHILHMVKHPLPPVFTPGWNLHKADWKSYTSKLSEVSRLDVEPFSLEDESEKLIFLFNIAADHAIPKSKPSKFRRSHWYSNQELKKARRNANRALRKYRRFPTYSNKETLQK